VALLAWELERKIHRSQNFTQTPQIAPVEIVTHDNRVFGMNIAQGGASMDTMLRLKAEQVAAEMAEQVLGKPIVPRSSLCLLSQKMSPWLACGNVCVLS
jgi:hypothetical protein